MGHVYIHILMEHVGMHILFTDLLRALRTLTLMLKSSGGKRVRQQWFLGDAIRQFCREHPGRAHAVMAAILDTSEGHEHVLV